ncbi:hypothetical protein GCM10009602_34540 [Nocardiopsis tropica]
MEHGETTGGAAGVVEEGRLPPARTAGDEQGRAPSGPGAVQGVGEGPRLRVTATEAGVRGFGFAAFHVLTFAQRPPVTAGAEAHTGRFTDARTESHAAAPAGPGRLPRGSGGRVFLGVPQHPPAFPHPRKSDVSHSARRSGAPPRIHRLQGRL